MIDLVTQYGLIAIVLATLGLIIKIDAEDKSVKIKMVAKLILIIGGLFFMVLTFLQFAKS